LRTLQQSEATDATHFAQFNNPKPQTQHISLQHEQQKRQSIQICYSIYQLLLMLIEIFRAWPSTKKSNHVETILLVLDPQDLSRAQHEEEAQNVALLQPALSTLLYISATEEQWGTRCCTEQVPLTVHCVAF
jgi:hypothetical protein